jgi:hypothetical protein
MKRAVENTLLLELQISSLDKDHMSFKGEIISFSAFLREQIQLGTSVAFLEMGPRIIQAFAYQPRGMF